LRKIYGRRRSAEVHRRGPGDFYKTAQIYMIGGTIKKYAQTTSSADEVSSFFFIAFINNNLLINDVGFVNNTNSDNLLQPQKTKQ
jgi:hypothetical protein